MTILWIMNLIEASVAVIWSIFFILIYDILYAYIYMHSNMLSIF